MSNFILKEIDKWYNFFYQNGEFYKKWLKDYQNIEKTKKKVIMGILVIFDILKKSFKIVWKFIKC